MSFESVLAATATGDVTGNLPGALSLNPAADYEKSSAYHTVIQGGSGMTAPAAQTYVFRESFQGAAALSSASATGFYLDPADYPAGTKTLYLRMALLVTTNDVAPAQTFTLGLYPVTASSGAAGVGAITLGAVVAGSTAVVTTPAANARVFAAGADFAFPAAGVYAMGVVVAGAPAASSFEGVRVRLERRAV